MTGSFIYGDATTLGIPISSSGANRFEVRAQNVWFGTTNAIAYPAGAYLATSTGAYLTTGGTWTNSSDVNLKTDFQAIAARLRSDRSLRFRTSAEIVETAEQALQRAQQAQDDWFPHYDIAPCVIEKIDPIESEGAAMAYYRPPAVDWEPRHAR